MLRIRDVVDRIAQGISRFAPVNHEPAIYPLVYPNGATFLRNRNGDMMGEIVFGDDKEWEWAPSPAARSKTITQAELIAIVDILGEKNT